MPSTVSNKSLPRWVAVVERWGLPALLALFCVDAGIQAATRGLWFDELITYHVARLPSLGGIWEALRQTADGQPPATHLAMRLSHALFGDGEVGTRLPYLAGFAGMSVFLFLTIRRRVGAGLGLAAVAFVWSTWAYEYSYEARPYALLMCAVAAAFYFWSEAATGERRAVNISLFGASLLVMMSTHYYAGLLLIPFGVGELVRFARAKRPDWPIWAVLAAAPFVLLVYLPLLEGVKDEYTAAFWNPVEWFDTFGNYVVLLAPAAIPVTAALVAAGIAGRWDARPKKANNDGMLGGLPLHEALAGLTLAAIPLAYIAAAMLVTGAYVYRYSLPCVFGVAVVFVMVVHDWLGQRRRAHAALFLTLAIGFVAFRVTPTLTEKQGWGSLDSLERELAALERTAPGEDPIIVSAPLTFLPYHLYASSSLRERLTYLTDIPAARSLGESDSAEISIMKLARWAGYESPAYSENRDARDYYVLVHPNARFIWLPQKLEEDGVALTLVGEEESFRLYRYSGLAQAGRL